MTGTLPTSEVFGPTLQGEGPYAGRSVLFLRLGGCNLACSWCDTPYTWDASRYNLRTECPPMTGPAIVDAVNACAPASVPLVISGGEPLIHQNNETFHALLTEFTRTGRDVHIETNGTIAPNGLVCATVSHFSVSPKLPHAGTHKRSQDPTPWGGWGTVPTAILKYVVETADDVDTAVDRGLALGVPRDRIWVMPEGTSTETLQERWPTIARAAADHHINASHRLHVLAWGDVKGT